MNEEKPVLTTEGAAIQIVKLRLLPGFPNDPAVIAALIDLLRRWFIATKRGPRHNRRHVSPEQQLSEVIDHLLEHDDRWKGPGRLKEIYDEMFRGLPQWDGEGPLPN
jgi:hypothetical protein